MEIDKTDLPYFPFYPDDFTGDTELMSCSLASIGFWILAMCRMHKSPVYGQLLLLKQIAEQTDTGPRYSVQLLPIHGEKLARAVGRSLPEIQPCVDELLEAGVMKIDPETGAYYSKRMVYDHQLRKKRKAAGAAGGRATQEAIKNGGNGNPVPKKRTRKNAKAKSEDKPNQNPENGNGIVNGSGNVPESMEGGAGETGEEKTLYSRCMDAYFDFYKAEAGAKPEIRKGSRTTPSDGDALKNLIQHLSSLVRENNPDAAADQVDNLVVESLRTIFKNWKSVEDFYRKKINLSDIYANINPIIFSIKQKLSNGNKGTGGNSSRPTPGDITNQSLFNSISTKFGPGNANGS